MTFSDRFSPQIMVVDDDPTIRFIAGKTLGKAGFEVRTAGNGKEALGQVKDSVPDVIMLDVVMPEMDGFTTCSNLRNISACKDIPILMATGLDDIDSIHRAYEAGATDFITKPINWLILEHRLRYLLRSARAFGSIRSAEEALRRAHEELEQRVEERTRELKKINSQLQEEIGHRRQMEEHLRKAYGDLKNTQAQLVQSAKLASIGELAAGVVHELNQPLMVIRGYSQSLRRNRVTEEDLVNALERIEKNTGRMANIIDHLRSFSRQSQSDFKPVRVNTVIEESFLMVGEQLRLRNIEFFKKLSADLPPVKGDSNKLEQVLLNLITNARDAIEEKRKIRASENPAGASAQDGSAGRLEVITRLSENRKDHIEVLVKDSGCGIPENMIDKIFDPFVTTKEVGKGTGLGLSITYGIVKEHHAEIEVAETGLNGTTFRILLPIA
jgi:C4-dicarboxylate-specific signal transduction histidine kinase